MQRYRSILFIGASMIVAGLLAGCRVEEQGHPLIVHKGEYGGQKDTSLSAAQLDSVERAGADAGHRRHHLRRSGASRGQRRERPPPAANPQPSSPPLPERALENRMRMQSGQ